MKKLIRLYDDPPVSGQEPDGPDLPPTKPQK